MGATGLEPNNAQNQKMPVLTKVSKILVNTGFFNVKYFYIGTGKISFYKTMQHEMQHGIVLISSQSLR